MNFSRLAILVSLALITGLENSGITGEPRSLAAITRTAQDLLDIMQNDDVTHRMNLVKTAAILSGLDTRINHEKINLPIPTAESPDLDPKLLEVKRREIFEGLFMKYLTFRSLLDMKLCETFYTHIKQRKHSAMNCNNAMVAIAKFYESFTIDHEIKLFPILNGVARIMKKNDKRLKKLMENSTMNFPITDLIRDWEKIPDAEKKFTDIIARKLDEEKRRVNDVSSNSMNDSSAISILPELGELDRSWSYRYRGSFRKQPSNISALTVKSSEMNDLIDRLTVAKLSETDETTPIPPVPETGSLLKQSKQIPLDTNEARKKSIVIDSLKNKTAPKSDAVDELSESDPKAFKLRELDRSDGGVKPEEIDPLTGVLNQADYARDVESDLESTKLKVHPNVDQSTEEELLNLSREMLYASDLSTLEAMSADEEGIPFPEAITLRERYGFDFPGSTIRYDPSLIQMIEEQRRIVRRNEAIAGLHDLMWEEALSIFGDYLPNVDNFFNDALNRKEAFLTSLHDMIPEGVDEITPYWTYIARQAKILYASSSAEGESSLKKMREYVLQAESEKRQAVNYEKIQLASMNLIFRTKHFADFTVVF